jgi:conjugative transposon TraM protein
MTHVQYPPAFLRKRKMLLVLPVLVLPFITLIFWSLGGGKIYSSGNAQVKLAEGLNLQLPDARLKDDQKMNKLSYYEIAAYDSAKREELLRNDPYYKVKPLAVADTVAVPDSNEEKVYRKLAELDKELNKNDAKNEYDAYMKKAEHSRTTEITPDVDRLERMMDNIHESGKSENPEMNQLDGMLDKIMRIQHPEEVHNNSLKQKEKLFPVSVSTEKNNISLFVNETEMRSGLKPVGDTGFYSIGDSGFPDEMNPNAIEAVIHETRTLVNGSIVKMRLLSDVYINGQLIPKGNFVYGKAALNGERLSIEIPSIRYHHSLYPVSLSVSDLDGLDGVFIPGAITRDVAKESSDRAIQGVALSSLDPSIGAQAASAGIEAAKTLLTKKVKLIKVTVKAGYRVLLKDKKN